MCKKRWVFCLNQPTYRQFIVINDLQPLILFCPPEDPIRNRAQKSHSKHLSIYVYLFLILIGLSQNLNNSDCPKARLARYHTHMATPSAVTYICMYQPIINMKWTHTELSLCPTVATNTVVREQQHTYIKSDTTAKFPLFWRWAVSQSRNRDLSTVNLWK